MRWSERLAQWMTREWYSRLTALFLAALLWQFLGIFETYWWEETFLLVFRVLLVAAAIELLLPGPRVLRMLLQLGTVVYLTVLQTGYQYVARPEGMWQERALVLDWLAVNFNQLHPFIGLVLAVWGIYQLLLWWPKSNAQMTLMLTVTLLSLLIVDSFTPLRLWDNVAWSACAAYAAAAWHSRIFDCTSDRLSVCCPA